jgi:hypothetical protein
MASIRHVNPVSLLLLGDGNMSSCSANLDLRRGMYHRSVLQSANIILDAI